MRRKILATGLVQTDDTPVKVQTGGPRTKRGFIWVYCRPAPALDGQSDAGGE
jgi:hypothetical protein